MLYTVLKYNVVDDEIEEVIAHYRTISDELGNKAQKAILQALYDLQTNAHHYFLLADKKHRRKPINGFPYMLVYTIDGPIVLIKILFPQRSDPANLLDRLK